MKKILTLAIISLLLASTFSVFNSQVIAEDASTLTQSFNEPILLRELTIPDRARVVDYDDGIYAVGTSNGDLYVINESGEYTVTHLGDFMISDVRIKSPFIAVAANHIYDKGEYWYDTYHYRYASFDYGYVIKFTLSGLTPNEQWRTRIESWGYWSEGTWDGMSDTYQNFALPSVDLSSDGNYVAYLSHYDVGILKGSDGTPIASYSISGAYIVSWLDATDDMEYIAITAEVGPYYGGENTGVELYRFDGTSLNRVWGTILIYRYETTEVKISEDKRYVAVATSSGTEMNLLDLATGSILWRYDATQEQFAVDGDRNLNYIIGATQYDPYVSPSPPYRWFIIHNLGTTFEVIAEGNMNGPINDLDSNDDASLLAFGSDAGEVILLKRTDNSIEMVYNFNIEKLIDSIEIGTYTFLVGGESFVHLYSIGWLFRAPFAFQRIWISCTPLAPNPYAAAAKGLSGVVKTEVDVSTGSLGYTSFTWGGYEGFFNAFVSEERNRPNQICKVETGLGIVFTPPFTGNVKIEASFSLDGKGVGQAGAGALDLIAKFLPWNIPFLGPSKTFFPTVAAAKNRAFLQVNELRTYSDLQGVGVASAIFFPSHMEVNYAGTKVTITATIFVREGESITILAGLTSELKSWGNAAIVMNLENSRLDYILVTRVSASP